MAGHLQLWTGTQIQNHENSLHVAESVQTCSFFQILSWNSASQPPLFLPSSCSTCLSQLWHIEKILEHHFWTRDTLKKVMVSLPASLKPSSGEWQAVILLWSVGWISDISLQIKNIRHSGWLPKYSSSVLIPPCKSWNLVVEQCQMTDLRCRTILLAWTLVSH